MPKGYDYVKQNKNKFLLELEEDARFTHVAAGKCIGPCFGNMQTSVVSTVESECMTNCIAKAMETKSLFQYLQLKQK